MRPQFGSLSALAFDNSGDLWAASTSTAQLFELTADQVIATGIQTPGLTLAVAAGALMSGSPAFEAREWLRAITAFPKLPDLLKTVRQLEKRLDRLEGAATTSQ